MRWPHQIWRLMHQSRMFSIQLKKTLSQRLGWMVTSPLRTASMAGWARGFMRTNHCLERRLSTTVWQR